ncbi:MAG: hypothetical protein LWX51_12145 [Deltaproteobacteria bacterium]|nr:hypothetical protein [Deltaproteobacteria bacterium]
MRRRRLLVLNIFMMLTIAFVQNTFAWVPKEPLYIDLSKTLGFVMGQRFSLNRIKVEYPALSLQVQKAELEFKATFGIAEKNIEKSLRDLLKDKYPEYIARMEKQLESTLKSQQISQNIAVQFFDEVESRAKGKIPSPMLETLLNYQFEERPADELIRRFKTIYRTKGHPKAKGLDLQIEYAKSWSLREGNRPNVIQFFSSNNGRGPAHALIMIRDLVKEAQGELTREELKALKTLEGSRELASEVFSESSLREMANGMGIANIRNITTKRVVLDRWPGAMLEFIGDQHRLDLTVTMYNRVYIAIYKNYMIFFQCQVAKLPDDTDDALKTKISKFAPLFHLMANSLVIQSQY